MGEPLADPRFSHVSWDPKFNRVPRRERKVKIDDRFKSMFTESKFEARYKLDKRGRKIDRNSREDLKKYYEISSEEASHESDDEEEALEPIGAKPKKSKTKTESKRKVSSIDEASSDDDGSEAESEISPKISFDLARGEGNLSSSDDDGNSSSNDDWKYEDDDQIPEHEWGEFSAAAPKTDQPTHRLAVCHADWDHMKAKDLLVLFNSFKPPLGLVRSVKIYPSEFGKARMTEEQTSGPQELAELSRIALKLKSRDKPRIQDHSSGTESDESDDDHFPKDGNEEKEDELKILQREKIRQYQFNRLKYYYAVVECDSPETSNAIYEACDGIEFESSATKIDLRFIPEEMSFNDSPTDEANQLGDLSSYEPIHFRNAALQQSTVELTWDKTSETRKQLIRRAFDKEKLDQLNFNEILASGSSDDEADKQSAKRDALKSLVDGILKGKKPAEVEDSFFLPIEKPPVAKTAKAEEEFSDDNNDSMLEVGPKKKKGTPWKEYLEKRKDKRSSMRIEQKGKKEKSKRLNNAKLEDEYVPDGVDLNDPYFREELDKFDDQEDDNEDQSLNELDTEDLEEDQLQKQQLQLLLSNANEGGRSKNYSLKKLLKENVKTKKKRRDRDQSQKEEEPKEDNFKLDMDDARFSALYESNMFSIDPSEPAFKKTKNMQTLVEERLRRTSKIGHEKQLKETALPTPHDGNGTKMDSADKRNAELSLLVKSVKSKANVMKEKKRKNVK